MTSGPRASGARVHDRDVPSWNDLGPIGLGVLGGLSLASAFPQWNIAPLAVIGPALLVVALRGRRVFLRGAIGLAFGVSFFGALLSWGRAVRAPRLERAHPG